MSWEVTSKIRGSKLGSPTRKIIMLVLADVANHDGSSIFLSTQRIADETEVSQRTVKRVLKDFEEEGLLIRVGKRPCMGGYTVIYDMDLDTISAFEPALKSGDNLSNSKTEVVTQGAGVVSEDAKKDASSVTQTILEQSLLNNPNKNYTKNEEFELKPEPSTFDETFEKLWKEIYNLLPEEKKVYASKKQTKARALKITKRKTDPISISRIAHAVLHYYNSAGQKKDNRKFCKAPQYVIGDELFLGFVEKGKFETGPMVGKSDNDALWRSRASRYAVTGKFDAQWVKGSVHNVPKEIWKYFPEEAWVKIGFIKKDLS